MKKGKYVIRVNFYFVCVRMQVTSEYTRMHTKNANSKLTWNILESTGRHLLMLFNQFLHFSFQCILLRAVCTSSIIKCWLMFKSDCFKPFYTAMFLNNLILVFNSHFEKNSSRYQIEKSYPISKLSKFISMISPFVILRKKIKVKQSQSRYDLASYDII